MTTKTETADRVRGRIERILDYATMHHYREGDNPFLSQIDKEAVIVDMVG